jgi:tRNA threonylcarbamoyladenosine biosynthesis protein TsaB
MLLLVTDTSGKNGSVALAQARDAMSASELRVIENVPLSGGTFSAQLVPQIAALLAKHGFKKTDIGAFIVVSGPGSFTGLRVGLAAIKGLAEILGKPIVPVSLLELIAQASGNEGKVLSALDAGRGEVYAGEYKITGEVAHVLREQLISKSELLSAGVGFVISTPDATLAGIARDAGLKVFMIEMVSVQMIAQLGWRKLREGETLTPEQLEANYIRRTDAEIFAKTSS